jgi:Domain of unknown function (DUF4267)
MPTALPILTALVGSGGFIAGLHSFVFPISAARVYGIPATSLPESNITSTSKTSANTWKEWQEAYVHAFGVRNLTVGTSILGMTGFWRFSSMCQLSPLAAQAVKRSLGIVLLAGSMTPIADTYFISKYVKQGGISTFEIATGKRASKVHALRSLIWIGVALSCLLT